MKPRHHGHNGTHDEHKPLWPMDSSDALAVVLAAIVAFVAAGAGIGGGGILLPIFVLICKFEVRHAVALSNVTVLGASFGNAILNIGKRHPNHQGPLIDWDLILIMEPMTILGAILGAYLDALLPGWMTAVLLSTVLSYISYNLLFKAIRMYEDESRAKQDASSRLHQPLLGAGKLPGPTQAGALQPWRRQPHTEGPAAHDTDGSDERSPRLRPGQRQASDDAWSSTDLETPPHFWTPTSEPMTMGLDGTSVLSGAEADAECETTAGEDDDVRLTPECSDASTAGERHARDMAAFAHVAASECAQVPLAKLLALVALTGWVAASGSAKSAVACGSLLYWAAVASNAVTCVATTLAMRVHLMFKAALRRRVGAPPPRDAIRWTRRRLTVFPLLSSMAGVVAGLFGVGGGIIKGPLMLELGVQPEVASASAATMILFTTGAASICNWHFGFLDPEYALVLMSVAFVSTLAGQWAMSLLMARLRRPSLVVMLMFLLLAGSGVAMYYSAYLKVSNVIAHPEAALAFGNVCGVVNQSTEDGGMTQSSAQSGPWFDLSSRA